MKILVIDRDQLVSQMISSRLESEGHQVVVESVKNDGIERLGKEAFDVVFIDPSPMKDARAMVLSIRRAAKTIPYLIFITEDQDVSESDVRQMGCNDYVFKPLDQADIHQKIDNAQTMQRITQVLADPDEDFPNAGGVISKSAFNQLFLSALDRGGRYNERAFLLSIAVENYQEIKTLDGAYNAEYSVSKLAYHMVRLRRQSDIIGQTAINEYSLLLQRTQNTKEAMDAASRFAAALDEIDDFLPQDGNEIKLRIALTDLPTGYRPFDHVLSKKITLPAH